MNWRTNCRGSSRTSCIRTLQQSRSRPVWNSNSRGASPPPLNHGLHAIDATPVRWHGNVVSHRSIPSTRLTVRFPHRYDDGEIETYVNKKFITVTRAKSRSRSRSKSDDSRSKKKRRDRSRSSSSDRSRSPKRGRKLREGDKCEARFRGKSSAKYGRGVLRCVTRRSPTPSTQVLQRQGVSHPFGRHHRCEVRFPRLRPPARGDDVFLPQVRRRRRG